MWRFNYMNFWTLSSILIFFSSVAFAIIVLIKASNKRLSVLYSLFSFSVALWGLGGAIVSLAQDEATAFFWWRISICGVILIPATYAHFIYALTQKHNKFYIYSIWTLAGFYILYNFYNDNFIGKLKYVFNQFFWMDWPSSPDVVFISFYILFYWALLIYASIELLRLYISSYGTERSRYKYFLIASMVGWIGGESNFLTTFGLDFYPYFNFLIVLYSLIFAYATIKHRLLDISLVLTRTSIFIAVYSLVLGLPFLVAFGLQDWLKGYIGEMWWLTPLILLTILATGGPFIYLAIQKRAEEKLFADQRRYQATLRQAATGMGRIKDMEKLVGLIESVVVESVGVEHCRVYTAAELTAHGSSLMEKSKPGFHELSPPAGRAGAISYERGRIPLVYSELKQRAADSPDAGLDEIVAQMEALNAELIVPVILDNKVVAQIVIGRKVSGELFSNDDISVFEILASQAALGFENAQYYDDMKSAHERLFQAEKLAYVGTMASSIVHEIRNPLTSIKAYLEFLPRKYHEPEFKKKFDRLIPAEIGRIERIVNRLLDMVRRRPVDFQRVNIVEVLDATLEMLENSFQLKNIEISRDYRVCPIVQGDPEQLKQVFMNVFLNAVQSMESGGALTIYVRPGSGSQTEICIEDTGCGIPDEQMKKLFQPFATTKKHGVGLGLPILKEIIENHNGTVAYRSEYMQGTKVYVTLPTVLK